MRNVYKRIIVQYKDNNTTEFELDIIRNGYWIFSEDYYFIKRKAVARWLWKDKSEIKTVEFIK